MYSSKNFLRKWKIKFTLCLIFVGMMILWNISYIFTNNYYSRYGDRRSAPDNRSKDNMAEETGSNILNGNLYHTNDHYEANENARHRSIHTCEWNADDFCISRLYDVYWHPLFPAYPSRHYFIPTIESAYSAENTSKSAIRRFLFLICPQSTDRYQFSVFVQGGFDMFISEWIKDAHTNWKLLHRFNILDALSPNESNKVSEWIILHAGKVYKIDFVHVSNNQGFAKLHWRVNGKQTFKAIYNNDTCPMNYKIDIESEHHFPLSPIVDERRQALKNPLYWFYKREQRTLADFNVNLKECKYTPSYIINYQVQRFSGWGKVQERLMFPYYPLLAQAKAAALLSEKTATNIVSQIWSEVTETGCRHCQLDKLIYVEQNRETRKGHRFFVEIDVTDTDTGQVMRISDYVYQKEINSTICLPKGHVWRENTDVNIVFTTSLINKKWTLFLLDSIAKILYATGDTNVKVLFAAYGMRTVDLESELVKRNLRGGIIHMDGKFNKVKALNTVTNAVDDPESIIFTIDLHLELPFHLFDQVRKHTILGKALFAPILVRLQCGKHLEYTDPGNSFWIWDGFGMIGVYKKDWDIIGGMNEELFGTTWGGEDWELMDRVVSKGYEVVRRRLSGFYHIYHSRKGSAWYEADESKNKKHS